MQEEHKIVSLQYITPWTDNSATEKYVGSVKDQVVHVAGFLVDDRDDDCITVCFRESKKWVYENIRIPRQCIVKDTYKEYVLMPNIDNVCEEPENETEKM